MVRVGITGLRDLSRFDRAALERRIRAALEEIVGGRGGWVMLNSIAAGADQLCAEIGLALGCELICPLPFAEYRRDFGGEELERYDRLLARAGRHFIVTNGGGRDAAYLAAGRYIAERCDVLLAVWDGRPQTSLCGTAAVTAYAQSLCKDVRIVE